MYSYIYYIYLKDFRQYSYGLPTVKGCHIHMDEKQIMVLLPRNRYDQVFIHIYIYIYQFIKVYTFTVI